MKSHFQPYLSYTRARSERRSGLAQRDLNYPAPSTVRRLMEFDGQRGAGWCAADLAAILRHQFDAPLAGDLAQLDEAAASFVAARCSDVAAPVRTFGDLLHHPSPPIKLLELTKRFAQAMLSADRAVPKEVATVLYFASIVAARTRCRRRITSMSDRDLRDRLRRLVGQPWLDARTRLLLITGIEALSEPTKAADAAD